MKRLLISAGLISSASADAAGNNTMTKVIELLTDLKKKGADRAKKDEAMYEEFATYCDDEEATRKNSIKEAAREIEDLTAIIQSSDAKIATSADIIQSSSAEIAKNDEEIAGGKKERAEEKEVNLAAQKELEQTINMLSRAKTVLQRTLSFAQGGKAAKKEDIQDALDAVKLIISASSTDIDNKRKLESFLQSTEDDGELSLLAQPQAKTVAYESKSGSIVTVIEDMKDEANEQLQAEREKEMTAAHEWAMMEQNLTLSNKALSEKVADAQGVSQAASSEKAQAEKDLAAQEDAKKSDEEFLASLVKNCKAKADEWAATQKAQAAEQKALAQAIEILGAKFSFMAVKTVTRMRKGGEISSEARAKAAKVLKQLGRKFNSFALMEVAAAAQTGDVFEKVRGLITDMISKLQKQAEEEATKKAFCDEETKKSTAKRDDRMAAVEKHQTRLDKAVSGKAKLETDIKTLQEELMEMSEAMAKMSKMRAEEKAEFDKQSKDLAESETAVQGALEVLRQHYGASGAALLQQPAGPEFGGPQTDAATMILGILEQAAEDFGVQLAEAKAAENEASSDFDDYKQKDAVAKASKEAAVKGKEAEVASLTEMIQTISGDKEAVSAELDAVLEYIEKLKPQCTQKVETYEERKAKREAEITGLKEALEILSDPQSESFIQKQAFLSTRTA